MILGRDRTRRAADRLLATPSLVYAVVAALAFPVTEMLVAGRQALQYAHDAFDTIVPLNAVVADALASGSASLWSTAITAGNSVLVQGAVPPATPDVWLGIVLPPFVAYLGGVVLLIWVAGYGMHRFLRDSLGLPLLAAYGGGVIYALSFWHVVYGFSAALLPLLLWSTDRLVRGGARWQLPAAGVVGVAALTLWWGHLQVIFLVGLAHLAYLVAIGWGRMSVVRSLGSWVGIWAVAGLLFAPVLVAQLVMLPDSQREIWDLGYLYDGTLGQRLGETLFRYRTVALGIPIAGISPGTASYYGTWFMGGIGLPLVILGLTARRTDARQRFLLALLLAIPIIDLAAIAVAPHMESFGILRSFQFVRIRHLAPFALAANAAIGLALLHQGGLGRFRRALLIGAVAAVVVLLAWQAVLAWDHATGDLAEPHRTSGWWMGVAAVAVGLIGAGLVVAAALASGRGRLLTAVLVVLVVVLVGERALYARHERLVDFGLGTWSQYLEVDPARAYVAERLEPEDRTLTAGAHPNATAMAGFHDAAGYSTVYPLAYHEVFGALIGPFLETHPALRQYFRGWGNRAYVFGPPLDDQVLDLLGVRWVYAQGMRFADPSLVERFTDGDAVVYENTDPLPRAYVASQVETHPSLGAIVTALRESGRDDLLGTVHLLEDEAPPGMSSEAARPSGSAEIQSYAADEVRILVEAEVPSILVLTDTQAPGWQATVNGEATEILAANGAFRGVPVPAGTNDVLLTYRPLPIIAAMFVATATAIALGGWTVWYGLARRRPRQEDER